MYRESDLQTCLFGLAGWRQNDNPDYPRVPASLIESYTGLYFQDEHPLVNLENIDQSFKNYEHFNYPAYTEDADYLEGAKVRYATDGKVYEALEDLEEVPGVLDPTKWEEVNLLAQKLEALTRAAINKVANRIFIEKKLNEVTKSIFENVQLFDGAGSLLNKEIKQGRFVGFQITLTDHRDITAVLRRLGTQFSAANPDFKLYVFHSSQLDVVTIFDLALTKVSSFEWSALRESNRDYALKYLDEDLAPGGSFYVGYYEDDLVGQAINKGFDFGTGATCKTCNNDYKYYSSWSKFISVAPFFVAASDLEDIKPSDTEGAPILWDIEKNQYQYTKNYGLNLDISVRCDVTDFFCREKTLFTDAIIKQVCVDVLNELAYGTRNNSISKQVKELALFELNNRDNNTPGANKKLDLSIKALGFDTSDMNEACLPCSDKWGSSWSAV